MKREKGITLMALVITIIVLLLLAGISITMLSGDNGIIRNAGKSKMQTEIATLKEGLELKDARMQSKDNYKKGQLFGDMEEVLGEEYKRYKDRYSIEAGNIVYKDKKFSREEIEILEENGIEKESKHYL